MPTVFPTLEHMGIKPRRGQVTMFFGFPGAGKTFFALLWALRLNVSTLFFSLDTDPGTMAVRTIAMRTGVDQDQIERELREGKDFSDVLAGTEIQYSFLPEADLVTVDMEIRAYVEQFGAAPELVIIDNLLNVSADAENEWQGMRALMKSFHALCRLSGSAVWILHHANEGSKPHACPPKWEVQGKLAQLPELILSVGQRPTSGGDVEMGVACVKNRRGRADPTGDSAQWFATDLSRMQFFETRQEAYIDQHRRSYA